jgi:Kef-type K+ transport system membrane component KefB
VRTAAGYALLVGAPVLVLLATLRAGHDLTALHGAAAVVASRTGAVGALNLPLLVAQIVVLLAASRAVGMFFRVIGQPQVMGEMAAGILLGPSFLGWVAPTLSAQLFPASSLSYLNVLSQVGLVLFMFLVGLSLDHDAVREQRKTALFASHVSIAAPFCLGVLVALRLYPRLATEGVTFTGFALFMGVAMSVTAFPVLARILRDRGMMETRLGTLALACAAIDDATGWCILAYVVAAVRVGQGGTAWTTAAGVATYAAAMLLIVKRVCGRFDGAFRRSRRLSDNALCGLMLLILASALATELVGVHLLFGAFFLGAVMPKTPGLAEHLREKFESVTVVLLLPLFFAYSGMRTTLGAIRGELWLDTLLIVAVAIAGKLGGSAIAARASGLPWRDATALGILMNTRGLMELVILNIGLDIGVISPAVFSMMVVMALATTLLTAPLLHWVYPARRAAAG